MGQSLHDARALAFRPHLRSLRHPVTIRHVREGDEPELVSLYRRNEPGRFPPGAIPGFLRALRRASRSFLVVQSGDEVVACGGFEHRGARVCLDARLFYGMVDPGWQRAGIGTLLLQTRLALLPQPLPLIVISMLNVPRAMSFYRRFGLASWDRPQADGLRAHVTTLDAFAWHRCRAIVASQGIDLAALENVAQPGS